MSYNIEKIIYINLNKRPDRREQLEQELNSFNLNYERYEAIETENFGTLGCGLSHLNVLKLAKERKYKNILILEDDFTFLVSKEEFENQLTKFFNLNIDYNVCMLAYSLKNHTVTDHDIILKALNVQTASGYIVNSNYYDKLIILYEWALPLLEKTRHDWVFCNDQIWKVYQKEDLWYCFTTRIGKQRISYSDITKKILDYGC
jgi:GR25 family glycosyltransferase involved in LPS biosynthesis